MGTITLFEVIVWFFIIFFADISAVLIEYKILKPRSNDTMVSQLEKLAKTMAKMDGWKKEAKQLKKLALEVKKEDTDVTPVT